MIQLALKVLTASAPVPTSTSSISTTLHGSTVNLTIRRLCLRRSSVSPRTFQVNTGDDDDSDFETLDVYEEEGIHMFEHTVRGY